MLDDSAKPHTRVFDIGSNSDNIFTKPDHPSVDLSRAVMVGMELLQTSNSFPYSGVPCRKSVGSKRYLHAFCSCASVFWAGYPVAEHAWPSHGSACGHYDATGRFFSVQSDSVFPSQQRAVEPLQGLRPLVIMGYTMQLRM